MCIAPDGNKKICKVNKALLKMLSSNSILLLFFCFTAVQFIAKA